MTSHATTYAIDGATREIRASLRASGWRWSPSRLSWTRATLDGAALSRPRGCRLLRVTDDGIGPARIEVLWTSKTYVAPAVAAESIDLTDGGLTVDGYERDGR